MTRFNLSDWALGHRSFIWFLMVISLVAGALAYTNLGREEDPSFTIRTMVIIAALPGATAEETVTQVTDRIELKLQELETLKHTRSVTYPGRAIVYVDLREETRGEAIIATWNRVRNMMSDLRPELPQEFAGFAFNDSFGDVFGSIYALTGDGYAPEELEAYAELLRDAAQELDASGRIELLGTQDRVIHAEFSSSRLAALGLDAQSVIATLRAQNALVPSGMIETRQERLLIRVSDRVSSAEALAATPLRSGDVLFTLADVAEVHEGYVDPPVSLVRVDGKPAVAVAVSMRTGSNILAFGQELDDLMESMAGELPVGISLLKIADQPKVVDEAVGHFVRALAEAVAIVLVVSFISLGVRAGLVVSLSIPLVLAITFVILDQMGVTLQRVSLGALIISLGLLVDDAMIAIETMISRLELGWSRARAASYAWTSVAFPMLSGTLVTVAGFIPIGLNSSQAGEFTRSLFYVIAISLLVSWVVAVLFAPVLGAAFLPRSLAHKTGKVGWLRRSFHWLLGLSMRHAWATLAITAAIFGASVWGLTGVERQFFPASDRPEVVVDITLRQSVSFAATDAEVAAFEEWLGAQEEPTYFHAYVGEGAPRLILTMEGPTPGPNIAQIVIMTAGVAERDALIAKIHEWSEGRAGVQYYPKLAELGPPVGKPVQYRISGPEISIVRDQARELATLLSQEPRLIGIELDWNEPVRVVRVELDQVRLRQLGLSQADIANMLSAMFEGSRLTQLRDGRSLIDVRLRGLEEDRSTISSLENLQFAGRAGDAIPLSSIARLDWELEQPQIRQRDRQPTITVKAAIASHDQPATLVADLGPSIATFADTLPQGYVVATGGTVETSGEAQAPIIAVVPAMLLIILFLVMMQVQSFRLLTIVVAVAPLALVGVVAALLLARAPLGFVAILGVLALMGILIRNSIILVQTIEDHRREGMTAWQAVWQASDDRARPILLTAAAASFALFPISRQVFWGPMAYAMMGGIIAGTLITLVFVPALYCVIFRLKPEKAVPPDVVAVSELDIADQG